MYGMKGGSKQGCVYPTVKNVREHFYQAYPGEPLLTYDPTRGDIPILGMTKFRQVAPVDKLYTIFHN